MSANINIIQKVFYSNFYLKKKILIYYQNKLVYEEN